MGRERWAELENLWFSGALNSSLSGATVSFKSGGRFCIFVFCFYILRVFLSFCAAFAFHSKRVSSFCKICFLSDIWSKRCLIANIRHVTFGPHCSFNGLAPCGVWVLADTVFDKAVLSQMMGKQHFDDYEGKYCISSRTRFKPLDICTCHKAKTITLIMKKMWLDEIRVTLK